MDLHFYTTAVHKGRGCGREDGDGDMLTTTIKWLWDSTHLYLWNPDVDLPRKLLIRSDQNVECFHLLGNNGNRRAKMRDR